ncbi:hypothetical protein [Kitasatospora cheerisanensis]|uniref:Uncharacterized protein n=1 Tax=Kitasatospora cheerisanensis KCTC 2395 TaxID=1348663 RepID=A0A066YVR2_9ACTN|nr:hypothetical protein [Kitasatospora cheerisanensis]KDN85628.1 hypothetical protein KCH_26450 [Kitasatospora cheerisanensis KCTC 2395]
MIDLEERLTRVHNPDVRPLVQDAYRSYATGVPRAAIVLTWTAVCADLIAKAQVLAEDGEPDAKALAQKVEEAQQLGGASDEKKRREGVGKMLEVEREILDAALALELIDSSQHVQLDRLREDRHQSAHPSLRPLGELYEPTAEYARAHLLAALDALLIHPPSQGRKIVASFAAAVADPGFVLHPAHLTHTYFDRVRPAARNKVVEFAARFAVLQIDDPQVTLPADQLADRMAECLRCFADRDAELVTNAMVKQMTKLGTASPDVQLAAFARLGNMPTFWKAAPETLRGLFETRVEQIGAKAKLKPSLVGEEFEVLGLVVNAELRQGFPSLVQAVGNLHYLARTYLIANREDAFYTRYLASLLRDVKSFDSGASVADLAVVPCGRFLDLETLREVLRAWWDNNQNWGRRVNDSLAAFKLATAHLGPEGDAVWREFLEELREYEALHQDLARRFGFTDVLAAQSEPE